MNTSTFNGHDLNAVISAGLIGVKDATLRQGPRQAAPRPASIEALGIADDYVKRVYFYHRQLVDEQRHTGEEMSKLMENLVGGMEMPRQIGPFLVALCDGSKLQAAERIAELELEHFNRNDLIDQVAALFWTEARRRNPNLYGFSKLTLHSDWTFSGVETPESLFGTGLDVSSLLDLLKRSRGGEDLFPFSRGENDFPGGSPRSERSRYADS